MRLVDLHSHTVVSDGTLTPTDLVRLAKAKSLAALAVTDHDHTGGIDEAQVEGHRLGVEVVAGIELSLSTTAGDVHLLGYLFDPQNGALLARLEQLRESRARRAERIVERLVQLGVPVTMEEVAREASADGASIGRPHVARALVRAGHATSIADAFDRWLAEGKPANVPKERLSAREGISLVRGAGGVAVVAHPGLISASARGPLVRELAALGLSGVEVDHPKHDAGVRIELSALARELGLVATGGSDFHGDNKPGIELGAERVPYETLAALRKRAQ